MGAAPPPPGGCGADARLLAGGSRFSTPNPTRKAISGPPPSLRAIFVEEFRVSVITLIFDPPI